MKRRFTIKRLPNGGAKILCADPADMPEVRKFLRRLKRPIVGALSDRRCPLAPEYRTIGIELHLTGLTTREIADKHRMPVAEVRRVLAFVDGWAKGAACRKAR
jgi:hypothetical protein